MHFVTAGVSHSDFVLEYEQGVMFQAFSSPVAREISNEVYAAYWVRYRPNAN